MSAQKVQSTYITGVGDVLPNDVPSWDFIYETSTVRNPKYRIGDRVVLPDGRVFRYGLAGAAIASSDLAVSFAAAAKIAIETFQATSLITENHVHINEAGITEDELQGGYLIIYRTGYSTAAMRGILGNTASDSSDNVTITLDATLPYAITTSDKFEVLANPYRDLRQTGYSGWASFAGMPAKVVANGAYFWVQTWGPIWCALQSAVGATVYVRSAYFRPDGSLGTRGQVGSSANDQRAGFVIDRSPGSQGPPLIMLQVSP